MIQPIRYFARRLLRALNSRSDGEVYRIELGALDEGRMADLPLAGGVAWPRRRSTDKRAP